jgi:hypothetical protein
VKTYVKGTAIVAKVLEQGDRIKWTPGLSDYYVDNGVNGPAVVAMFSSEPFLEMEVFEGQLHRFAAGNEAKSCTICGYADDCVLHELVGEPALSVQELQARVRGGTLADCGSCLDDGTYPHAPWCREAHGDDGYCTTCGHEGHVSDCPTLALVFSQ